ncbi:MAG: hypothetical protein MJE68_05740 [Proteobacteria bacterium]|nr:hypothetical protein [Pseudomonadota bacterium]
MNKPTPKSPDRNKTLLDHKVQTLTLQRFGRAFTAALLVVTAALVVIEVTQTRYGEIDIESLPLFPAIFGFASFVFIVMVGKLLRKVLMRDEAYYDKNQYFTTPQPNTKAKAKTKSKGGGDAD